MPEALEKIQAVFKESKIFALLSKKVSEDFKLLAKEALKHVLLEKKTRRYLIAGTSGFPKEMEDIDPRKKIEPCFAANLHSHSQSSMQS